MIQSHHAQNVSTALIHSVVVLNISDQWTRARVQNETQQTVCGAVLGKQAGRNIEIWNSFELKTHFREIDGEKHLTIDEEYFLQRSLLYKETFADLEFLGFYVTGDHEKTDDDDIRLQHQARPHNDSPFLLKFNAQAPVISDKVAIAFFDSFLDPVDENHLIFQSVPVKIVSELAEQIGLDHVARYSKTGTTTQSTASKQMGAQFGAINTFIQGLAIAHDYVKAVRDGQLVQEEAILREIHKLCLKLSIHNDQPAAAATVDSDKDNLTSDHKLLVLLSAISSAQGSMFELVEKVNLLTREHLQKERSSMLHHHGNFLGNFGRTSHPMGNAHYSRFFF